MAIGLGNPLSSMTGASDSLGLSAAAKADAADIADKLKKKKMQDQMDQKATGGAGAQSAFQSLTGFGTL